MKFVDIFLPFFISLIFLAIGIITYILSKHDVKQKFLMFCFFTFHWQFLWFLQFFINKVEYADLIVRIGYSGIIFLPISFYDNVLSYLNIKSIQKKIFYILGIIFFISLWMTDYFIEGFFLYPFGYYPDGGWMHIIYMIMVVYIIISMQFKLYKVYKKENYNIKKKQILLIELGVLIYCFAAIDYLLNYPELLNMFNIHIYPIGVFFILASMLLFILSHLLFLTKKLNELNLTLEEKVDERTKALKDMQSELVHKGNLPWLVKFLQVWRMR